MQYLPLISQMVITQIEPILSGSLSAWCPRQVHGDQGTCMVAKASACNRAVAFCFAGGFVIHFAILNTS